jgi:Zn-dependent peptidase ImmA (M78 family)
MRFLIAKELFMFLYLSRNDILGEITDTPEEIIDIYANIFATYLLVPNHLLRKEVSAVKSSLDIVQQLADIFWVSKSFMNQRLREFMAQG